MSTSKHSHIAAEAIRILRTIYQLSTDLFSSENRQDLIFRILNNTIRLFPYQRAVLWSFEGRKPKIVGVSGQEDINQQAPLVKIWQTLIVSLEEKKKLRILNDSSESQKDEWKTLKEKVSGISVMWVPFIEEGKLRAGLWIERWGNEVWETNTCEIMESLAQNFSLAWKQFNPSTRFQSLKSIRVRRLILTLAGLSIVFFLYFQTISLRVVAPCEIIPKDPVMIAAPLEGVIKKVLVKPGDHVNEDDPLFQYEDRIVTQELKVAQKQVQIIESQYNRARLKAFTDDEAMESLRGLEYRLEQEKIRLELAESNTRHLIVRATLGGICMVDEPENWQGRPVQIGERVVMLFNPKMVKVKIYLPENDYILFNREKAVHIILNANPGRKYAARLNYVAPQTSINPQGGSSFIAEADLTSSETRLLAGSKGSAIVYGQKVRLVYWLLRKPIAGVRNLLRI